MGGMDLRDSNCAGKVVSFLVLKTVSIGDLCFSVMTWIHVCSPLMCQKEKTKAMQPTKAYDAKFINTALKGMLYR